MKLGKKFFERLQEPSTYAGFAGLAVALGISSEQYQAIATLIAAVFGVLAVFVSEKGERK